MTYKYTKGSFLWNKISGNIVKNNADTNTLDSNIWEIWTPKVGEWCWFTNIGDIELDISPHIGNLSYTSDYYDLCEPYMKSLPFGMDKRWNRILDYAK